MFIKKLFIIIFVFVNFYNITAQNAELVDSDTENEFYSIQNSGITACYGDRWFFQHFDSMGRTTLSVLYEKDKLLEKKLYTYQDEYLISSEITLTDKIIKIKYNKKQYEIEKIIYNSTESAELEKIVSTYNENNLLIEKKIIKNSTENISQFNYDINGNKSSQTDFINGEKVCFIEYKSNKKIIHLFENGKEKAIFEDEY